MKKFCFTLAIVLALGFTSSLQAAGPTPYKDKVTAEIFAASTIPGVGQRLDFRATGTATKLGRMTTLGFIVLNADFSFTGENTLIAANGDQIFLTIMGQLTPTSDPSVFVIQLQTVFESGTGRFVQVEGGFFGNGLLQARDGYVGSTFSGKGAGTIHTPRN